MKYDLNVSLKNEDGAEALEDGKPITMRTAILRGLVTDPPQLSAAQKLQRYELFSKIAATPKEEPADLSIDEVQLAKDAVNVWPTIVYGQVVVFLNQR